MPTRIAALVLPTLLAAAPISCRPSAASSGGAEAPGEPATNASADASSIDAGTTVATKPTVPGSDPATDAGPPAEPPVEAAVPRSVRVAKTVTVGKWPEEVAVLGNDAFVATSGSRIVRRVDLEAGSVKQSIRAGTFPVNIVAGANEIWAVDYNSRRTLFEIDASGKPTRRGAFPDHVEKLAFGDGILFALLAKNDSSVDSSVVRFDPKTGKQERSAATGKDPTGLAVGHGKVWAAAGGGVVVLDPESLAIETQLPVAARDLQIFTNAGSVYAASFSGGTYVRVDPATLEITSTVAVEEPFVMAVKDDAVVTLGHSGTLVIWDPEKGTARAQLAVGVPIEGQWMTWWGSSLVVTAHGTSDEKQGSLHVLAME